MAPVALAIMDIPPNSDYPNGFSPRWESFLAAVSRRFKLKIFGVRQSDAEWNHSSFASSRMTNVEIRIDDVPANPLWDPGWRARLRRLRHYTLSSSPAKAYPARFEVIERELAVSAPSVVISFLYSNTHLLRLVSGKAPVIAMLEEGFERTIPITGNGGRNALAARRELALIRKAHALTGRLVNRAVVISQSELEWFSPYIARDKLVCLEHGIDTGYFSPIASETLYDVAVVGVMSHPRNYRPARSLFDFMESRPETRGLNWAFVGREPHASLLEIARPNVTVTGRVDDLRPYYAAARAVVAPGTEGTGVKTTSLQAWAMGRPLVATSFAAAGTRHTPGLDVLIGDSDEAMATHLVRLLGDPRFAETMGNTGRQTICRKHDINVMADRFADLCDEVSTERPSN